MKKTLLSYSAIAVMLLIVVLVNSIGQSAFRNASLDLTQEKLYSLSVGSSNILKSISEPITLKFFFSRTEGARFPSVKLYGNRIADLLREYERKSNGKIRLEIYDPRADSEEEEWATKYGMTEIPTPTGDKLFLGVVGVNSLGEERSIPVFSFGRQEFLEYDLTKLVYALTMTKRPVVAFLSSLPISGGDANAEDGGAPWFFLQQLEQSVEVRQLKTDETSEIAPDVDLLIVVHPKILKDDTLYGIDQYALRGGKLIVLVDPYCQSDRPAQDPANIMGSIQYDRSSDLPYLLEKWGVKLVHGKAIADGRFATKVRSSREGPDRDFLLWPTLREEAFNKEDVVTNSLENVLLAWAGTFEISKIDGVTTDVLLKSSPDAQLIAEQQYKFNGGDPDALLQGFFRDGKEYPAAVRVRGKLKSAYPSGNPGQAKFTHAHLAESEKNTNILVIGDVDFLSDRFSVSQQNLFGRDVYIPLNDNQNLFLNSVENLLGSDDLISVRSRGQFARPFTVVMDLERSAQRVWQEKEMRLQAKLNGLTQRLNELLGGADSKDGEQRVLDPKIVEEIKQFREQKAEAQSELRSVRRNLRSEIEALGNRLFFINTFLMPLILIAVAVYYHLRRKHGSN